MNVMSEVSTSSLLQDALTSIAADVDEEFDTLLTLPGDARDRLYAAMRHATIGGGKRCRGQRNIAGSAAY